MSSFFRRREKTRKSRLAAMAQALPKQRCRCGSSLFLEPLEDRIVLTAPSFSWLASMSGYPTSDLYGTNPPVSELRSTMQQLASQYNVPIEIVAAVCWEESNCMQFDPNADGFVVRNPLEDKADYNYSLDHSPTIDSKGNATLPAQRVIVTDQLDPNLDWTTFQVGDFNIAGTTYTVPANNGSFSTRLDLISTLGIYLDVTAAIDLTTGIATWTFTSIDPATGDLPANSFFASAPSADILRLVVGRDREGERRWHRDRDGQHFWYPAIRVHL